MQLSRNSVVALVLSVVLLGSLACVLLSDEEALFVGAQVMSIQEELPITQEELKAGLIEIARKVASQL